MLKWSASSETPPNIRICRRFSGVTTAFSWAFKRIRADLRGNFVKKAEQARRLLCHRNFYGDFFPAMEYNTLITTILEEFSLKKLNDAINRFCAMHPNLAIPGLMRYIVISNALLYIVSMFDQSGLLWGFLAMDAAAVLRGQIWRLVTYVLIPVGGTPLSVLLSLIFYYWLGESMERLWGSAKFTFYYVSGTLLSALASILALFLDGYAFRLYGAVYVNAALFFAFALTYPEAMVRLFYIIPVKMKWLAILEAVLYGVSVAQGIAAGQWGRALTPVIALLNLFIFFSPDFLRRAEQVRAHNRREAVQFRRAVKEQKREKGYNHKCTVCGRTDTDCPDLQFRYCSKCAGYHCYCEDHIFNHVHFTE